VSKFISFDNWKCKNESRSYVAKFDLTDTQIDATKGLQMTYHGHTPEVIKSILVYGGFACDCARYTIFYPNSDKICSCCISDHKTQQRFNLSNLKIYQNGVLVYE